MKQLIQVGGRRSGKTARARFLKHFYEWAAEFPEAHIDLTSCAQTGKDRWAACYTTVNASGIVTKFFDLPKEES